MTLKLSVPDRLLLLQMLPQQGSKLEMLACDSIVKKVEFSEQEKLDFGIEFTNSGASWSSGAEVDIEFTVEQAEVLKNAARRVDDEKTVTRQHLVLLNKIDKLFNYS